MDRTIFEVLIRDKAKLAARHFSKRPASFFLIKIKLKFKSHNLNKWISKIYFAKADTLEKAIQTLMSNDSLFDEYFESEGKFVKIANTRKLLMAIIFEKFAFGMLAKPR